MSYLFMSYLLGYLIGGLSPSILLSHSYGFDIRDVYSNNAGATNMFRVNKLFGIIVFLLDFLKGVLGLYLLKELYPTTDVNILSMMLVIGHVLPIWYNFKGGKGVAVSFGVILYMDPYLFLLLTLSWLQNFYFVGVGFISTILSFGGLVFISLFYENNYISYTVWLFFTIIITHIENFKKLNDESV